jgi:hypothetical protein
MTLPWTSLRRQGDWDGPVDLPFLPTPSKSGAQYYQFPASGSGFDRLAARGLLEPPVYIAVAGRPRDRAGGLVSEKVEELGYREADEVGPARLRPVNFPVLGEHIRNQDLVGLTIPETWAALSPDVVGERFISRVDISLARACADLSTVVENDPDCVSPSALSKIESRAFASTRHSPLICSMLFNVV